MLFAKILSNQLATSLEHDRVVPLARFKRAVPFVAFPRTSLDGKFLHAFAFREIRKRNLDQEPGERLPVLSNTCGRLKTNYQGL